MRRYLALFGLSLLLGIPARAQSADSQALAEAVGWIRQANRITAEYDYDMSVKIRMLVFWISKESVGGGYIRRMDAPGDPQLKSIGVLFGSDPAKTKGVNRWGAGTEVKRVA